MKFKTLLSSPGPFLSVALSLFLILPEASGQMITGSWKGRINRQKVEVKIIQSGDSLLGTSYYYESPNNYRRYSIRGYFDAATNNAVWWDDQLLEEKSTRFSLSIPGKIPMLSRADFNCPGGGKMMLDGKAGKKESNGDPSGEVHLDKTNQSTFEDEWDFVIDNYTVGGNDPEIIDSIAAIATSVVEPEVVAVSSPVIEKKIVIEEPVKEPAPIVKATPVIAKEEIRQIPAATTPVPKAPTIEEKFTQREKKFIKEIPLTGDSLELRFYDNAEIDGDSISLFLNDKLLFSHIRLTGNAYTIKIPVSELGETNELIMVAENLGTIPPNTSYMVAMMGEQRYDAYLASTEGSSAMIRLVKKKQ